MNAPFAAPAIDPALVEALRALLGSRLSLSESDRAQHGRDESRHAPRLPTPSAVRTARKRSPPS